SLLQHGGNGFAFIVAAQHHLLPSLFVIVRGNFFLFFPFCLYLLFPFFAYTLRSLSFFSFLFRTFFFIFLRQFVSDETNKVIPFNNFRPNQTTQNKRIPNNLSPSPPQINSILQNRCVVRPKSKNQPKNKGEAGPG
ncbi:hypothetical protein NUU24_26325, partial [Escherichia coli]|uniref:hypothetical protein n=1 Tax=Escherichia coli TaxID=562 RepID=UPI00214F83BC